MFLTVEIDKSKHLVHDSVDSLKGLLFLVYSILFFKQVIFFYSVVEEIMMFQHTRQEKNHIGYVILILSHIADVGTPFFIYCIE